ncbi:hypothetical protein AB0K09_15670 [Streptomyces sp. NPDC049577]|uniref:hypothetical protein n=1 Tax=Streptomyces sp. NPDC049577 TaxID=3155153 RepID=UPI0034248BBB
MHLVLLSSGLGFATAAFFLDLTQRSRRRNADGLYTLGNALICMANLPDNPVGAVISGAAAAWTAHRWWNNGGGNGTRRRLRNLQRRFTATRRTAPVT